MVGIHYILHKATELGRPVAICIGVGTNYTSHAGNSLFENYIYDISGKTGVAVCCAAGNESNKSHHTQGKIEHSNQSKTIDLKIGEETEAVGIRNWTSAYDRVSVSLRSPTGEIIPRVPVQTSDHIYSRKLVLEKSTVRVQYYLGESNLCSIEILNPTIGIWNITVYGDVILDGDFHAWLPITGFIEESIEFLEPTPNATIVTPANAYGSITCGAYDSINNSLYISSSRGPSRMPLMQPDLVAPGVNIGGTYPYGKGTMSGTSVSTAITTGACAILLQWGIVNGNDSFMNTHRLRTFLVRGCKRSDELDYPNTQWGYGKLDLMGTFTLLKRLVY